MAHRRRIFKGQVTLAALGVLGFGLLMAGSIYISNETVGMRRNIAALEWKRENLEAGEGRLLTEYNAARRPEVIVERAIRELGFVQPENPDLVLVCQATPEPKQSTSLARKFLSKFGGGTEAQAGENNMGLVTGSMVSLTPRDQRDSGTADAVRP